MIRVSLLLLFATGARACRPCSVITNTVGRIAVVKVYPGGCAATRFDAEEGCSGPVAFDGAVAFCAKQGMRLCSADELRNYKPAGTGCGYDLQRIWSNTPCRADDTEWVLALDDDQLRDLWGGVGFVFTEPGHPQWDDLHTHRTDVGDLRGACSPVNETVAYARCCGDDTCPTRTPSLAPSTSPSSIPSASPTYYKGMCAAEPACVDFLRAESSVINSADDIPTWMSCCPDEWGLYWKCCDGEQYFNSEYPSVSPSASPSVDPMAWLFDGYETPNDPPTATPSSSPTDSPTGSPTEPWDSVMTTTTDARADTVEKSTSEPPTRAAHDIEHVSSSRISDLTLFGAFIAIIGTSGCIVYTLACRSVHVREPTTEPV